MGGKTLINNIPTNIVLGKTLFNGTLCDIFQGKTLIDGTVCEINFIPSLRELLMKMNIISIVGRDGTRNTLSVSKNSAPATGVVYWLGFYKGSLSIFKIVNREVQQTPLVQSFFNDGSTLYGLGLLEYNNNLYINNTEGYVSNTSPRFQLYAGTVALVSFPYDHEICDKILSACGVMFLTGADNSEATDDYSDISTTNQYYEMCFATRSSYLDVWEIIDNRYVRIGGTNISAATEQKNGPYYFLSLGLNTYGGSITGIHENPAYNKSFTISGSGNSSYCYIRIGIRSYISSTTITVHEGDSVTFVVKGTSSSPYRGGYLRINDLLINQSYGSHATTISWKIPKGVNTISAQLSYSNNSGNPYSYINVITT